jgi:hypothetical protein
VAGHGGGATIVLVQTGLFLLALVLGPQGVVARSRGRARQPAESAA